MTSRIDAWASGDSKMSDSEAARAEIEAAHHADSRRRAAYVVAACATDADDPAAADVDAMREWYAGIGVPWGVRVPAGAAWRHGRFLFRNRLMGLALGGGVAASPVPGVVVRRARAEDLDGVLHVDVIG